ncbi:efflux RND transporter periplasmic adaptor subunit [Humitalea rosea]|nr:efflux RND transporter periplasmic adaptor subunit [Humitalea rosea]
MPATEPPPTEPTPTLARTALAETAAPRLPIAVGPARLVAAPGWPRRLWGAKWRVLALLLLLAAAGYGASRQLLGPVVAVEAVRRGNLVQSVVASGRVETPHRVNIGAQVTGTVAAIPVRQGQQVEAGALLVVLEDSETRAGVEQAQGSLEQAEARLRQMTELTLPVAQENLRQAEANLLNAQQQFRRAESLRGGGFETQVQVDAVRKTLDVAEAQLRSARLQVASSSPGGTDFVVAETAQRQARAALQSARSRSDYTRIRAPVAGTLIGRDVEPGWVVQPNQVLMVLAPRGETQVIVQIDERNLGLVTVGQQAMASADAYPTERFVAELTYLNPGVDAQRASVEAKLRVPAPPAYLREDMTVSVDIAVAERAATLVLPVSAVHGAATAEPWVLRVEEGHARRRPIRIGLRGAQQVEVLEGLAEGDRVLPAAATVGDGGRLRVPRE